MHIESRATSFFAFLGLYAACSVVLLLVYTGQIGEDNAYLGMQPWDMSIAGYVGFVAGLPMVAWIVSRTRGRPSDFFRLFYGTIAIGSFLVLHPVIGPLSTAEIFAGIVLLLLPLLMLELFGAILPVIGSRGFIGSGWIEWLLVLALLVVVVCAAASPPASAGFGLDLSYDRRIEGRETYLAGSWLAYGLSMIMNGVAPYLAFKAGLRSRLFLFSVALAAGLFSYWLLGAKAPFVFVVVAALMGVFVRKGNLSRIAYYFLAAVLGLGLIALLEWVFFEGYSIVADYFFRRLFVVQAEIQGYYLKFLMGEKAVPWSWLYGSFDPDFSAAYHIGEYFMGNDESNANTNAFFHQFAAKGFIGYISALVLVPLVLVIFDRLYRSSRNPSYIFLGFLYGLLVVEQSYTVAMLSSGVGLLLGLTYLETEFDAAKTVAA
jgi:hypothetical protein